MEASGSTHHPVKQKTTKILDLNDDVLREIVESLDIRDLCKVAEVCTKFREIARSEFSLRFKAKCFELVIPGSSGPMWPSQHVDWYFGIHIRRLPFILRNFGALMQSFFLDLDESMTKHSPAIMKLIAKYCGGTLNELVLKNIKFTTAMVPELQPLLSRIGKLMLIRCSWNSSSTASQLFPLCSKLENLTIIGGMTNWSELGLEFYARVPLPKLVSLSLQHSLKIMDDDVKKFLTLNPQLKKIEIKFCPRISSQVIEWASFYVPQIERIDFLFNHRADPTKLHAFAHPALLSLGLDCRQLGLSLPLFIADLVRANVPLEFLHLESFFCDEGLVAALGTLKTLKRLELTEGDEVEAFLIAVVVMNLPELAHLNLELPCLSANDLIQILTVGPKLRAFEIEIDADEEFTLEMYSEVLAVVKAREEMCCVTIKIASDEMELEHIPKDLLEANKHLLNILLDW